MFIYHPFQNIYFNNYFNEISHLKFEKVMRKIKKKSTQGYFENLISRYLIENSHKSILIASPKADLGKKNDARERKKL